jgi:hypothetical protein
MPTVEGAQQLIHVFISTYRCAAHEAADGRQFFEVPSFLSLIGATAAIAFGAGEDVAVAGGIANSVFNAGKAYYVPQQKAEILDHALDALLCIQSESVGMAAFDATVPPPSGKSRFDSGSGSVSVKVERQYFNMVSSALFSVERVMAQRLNRAGAFDPAGVAAQIKTLDQQAAAAETQQNAKASARFRNTGIMEAQDAILELKAIQPKLQGCVVRAKI